MGNIISEIRKRHQLSINTDLDGICSAAVLSSKFKLRVESYTNSSDGVWYTDAAKRTDMVFVDYFLKGGDTMCIDQHVIDFEKPEKGKQAVFNPIKFNPNREFGITNSDYQSKYFSSTAQYLIWVLEKNGYRFDVDIYKPVLGDYSLLHFLCRADGTLLNYVGGAQPDEGYSGFKRENDVWIERMCNETPEDSITRKVFEHVRAVEQTSRKADVKKRQVEFENFLKGMYDGFKSDGFEEPLTGFFNLMKKIYNAFGAKINFSDNTDDLYKFELERVFFDYEKKFEHTGKEMALVVKDSRVFSYANVRRCGLSVQVVDGKADSLIRDYMRHAVLNYGEKPPVRVRKEKKREDRVKWKKK